MSDDVMELLLIKVKVLLDKAATGDVAERVQCHKEARELLQDSYYTSRERWRKKQMEFIRKDLMSLVATDSHDGLIEAWEDRVADVIEHVLETIEAIKEVFPNGEEAAQQVRKDVKEEAETLRREADLRAELAALQKRREAADWRARQQKELVEAEGLVALMPEDPPQEQTDE